MRKSLRDRLNVGVHASSAQQFAVSKSAILPKSREAWACPEDTHGTPKSDRLTSLETALPSAPFDAPSSVDDVMSSVVSILSSMVKFGADYPSVGVDGKGTDVEDDKMFTLRWFRMHRLFVELYDRLLLLGMHSAELVPFAKTFSSLSRLSQKKCVNVDPLTFLRLLRVVMLEGGFPAFASMFQPKVGPSRYCMISWVIMI